MAIRGDHRKRQGIVLQPLGFLFLISLGGSALAQASPIEPPRLIESERPKPPQGREQESAEVILELLIDKEGRVEEARVFRSGGPDFDAAALEAARRFRFEPARRGGTPIPARIRLAISFEPPPPESPPSSEPLPPEEPLEENAPPQEGEPLEGPPSQAPQALPIPSEEEVAATFSARAEVEPPPREAARRTLTSEVLSRIPGTRGDALRVVELLPGVGRPAFGTGVLLVRGAAPGDTEVFLGGSSVPLLYHFGGITSFFNSNFVNRIDFYPGNFSVRYGRRIGGILEIDPKDPRSDRIHGYADINVIDASFAVEAPIDRNLVFGAAARRSYIDFFFSQIVPSGTFSVLAAPVYYDYQAVAAWQATPSDRVRFFIYGSSDEIKLIFSSPSENDPNFRGNFGIQTQFHRGQFIWKHLFSDSAEHEVMASFGWTQLLLNFGESTRLNGNFFPIQLRSETRLRLSDTVRLIGGLDWLYIPTRLEFLGPQPTQSEGMPPMAAQAGSRVQVQAEARGYRPAVYFESTVTPIDRLDITTGVRLDYFREISRWAADPRGNLRLRLTEKNEDIQVNLRGGAGLFSQPPEFAESAPDVGNPNLRPIRAFHGSVGAEFRYQPLRLSATVDGFYKSIENRVVATPGNVPPFFTNDGIGQIFGIEIGSRLEPSSGFPLFGFFSYTLMRSERKDGPDQPWRLFDFDQTHILTTAWVLTPGDGWEFGATFRYVTGNPITPVVGAINDLSAGIYRPIYGEINSRRNPDFHRLDVRAQKQFVIDDFRLSIYIDIQNIYNSANPEGIQYNYNYTRSTEVRGLPIIPSLGIRGEI
ncbi:MAG: TonB-dependent receptor [Sandaracinaceae bacterium]|nr:TonB-dependent receptor [Sandaracinaceae bacterium]